MAGIEKPADKQGHVSATKILFAMTAWTPTLYRGRDWTNRRPMGLAWTNRDIGGCCMGAQRKICMWERGVVGGGGGGGRGGPGW